MIQSRDIMHSKEIRKEKNLAWIFMLVISSILAVLLTSCKTTPQWVPSDGVTGKVYPEENWQKAQTPEKLGWSSEKLAEARVYSEKIGSAAVMIVDDGVVVAAWGDVTRKFKCHSMRLERFSNRKQKQQYLRNLISVLPNRFRWKISKLETAATYPVMMWGNHFYHSTTTIISV